MAKKKSGLSSNFGGKQAAPFGKRKSPATTRKLSSTKTAGGMVKKTTLKRRKV